MYITVHQIFSLLRKDLGNGTFYCIANEQADGTVKNVGLWKYPKWYTDVP